MNENNIKQQIKELLKKIYSKSKKIKSRMSKPI